ncbi:MAG: Rieske 2Fe-2S domain-containing protein [Acidobacteria bacterium]|nr:Rieske 2Fe-2S domain-containing protein [Acidobacteriota bacterium]
MFVKVAKLADLPAGESMTVEVGGTCVALFNINGQFYALNNVCPHRGGPLSEGFVDPRNLTVQCPWHGWIFRCDTGVSPVNAMAKVQKFEVKVEGDELHLEVD